jgi:hypothetical protein
LDQHGLLSPGRASPPGGLGTLNQPQGGENTTFQIPDKAPRNVAGGFRQRLKGHQSPQEASLLSKLAATQWTQVQNLSPENKGGFHIYHLEQVTEMGGYSLSYT